MRYTPLWCIPLLAACVGKPQVQVVKDMNGTVRATVTRVNGEKEGTVCFMDPVGKLRTSGTYGHDSREGSWTTVSTEGDTLSILTFKDGRKQGLQAYWNKKGRLLRVERFDHGEPNGPLYRFFADGSPRQAVNYVRGVADGRYMEWYLSDTVHTAMTLGRFHLGIRVGTWSWFYGNGKLRSQGTYLDGRPAGIWRSWNAQGRPAGTVDHATAAPSRGS